MADVRRLAKNTIYMYIRMIIIMLVTFFTSRVVLDKLGVIDYGLYNAITSVVAVVVFLTDTLATTTSRFVTYDLGKGDISVLKNTFSTAFYAHLLLGVIILLLMETGGLWYMTNRFVIPEGREDATRIVFQIAIMLTVISIIMVPYIGLITAHEDMSIYAYVGIADAAASLLVAYLLSVSQIDKLVFYAVLLLIVKICISLTYFFICFRKYEESHLIWVFNKDTFKRMFGFMGWTAIANLSNTFTVQGAILLLNVFFSPVIIAAKALADQITSAIMKFVSNFRVALNPQIIKSQAEGNEEVSRKLTLMSTIVSFDLVLIIGLPFYFTMDSVLEVWLVEVPQYASAFAKIAILSQIIGVISSSTYIPFVASGKLKSNAIWGLITGVMFFLTLYLIFKFGGDAIWVQYLYLVLMLISVLVLRPYLLCKDVKYHYREIFQTYWVCFKVFISSFILSYTATLLPLESRIGQFIVFIIVAVIGMLCSYIFLDISMKNYIKSVILNGLRRVL